MSLLDTEKSILESREIVETPIHEWLKKNCNIQGEYKIIDDGSIIVYGNVTMPDETEIPNHIKFFIVTGDFRAQLTSLRGTPRYIGHDFYIADSMNLTSLRHGPMMVANAYICRNCLRLISPVGISDLKCTVFDCTNCPQFRLYLRPQAETIVGASFIDKSLLWDDIITRPATLNALQKYLDSKTNPRDIYHMYSPWIDKQYTWFSSPRACMERENKYSKKYF